MHGDARAIRKFSMLYPNMNESTERAFRAKYKAAAAANNGEVTEIVRKPTPGRPLKLGKLDDEVQRRLKLIRESGGRVDANIACAVAQAVHKVKGPNTDIDITKGWAKSLFQRMGYTKRAATTGKLNLPKAYVDEKAFTFLNDIAMHAQKDSIPNTMILNWDQTPLQYVPSSKYTMAQCGSSKISIAGSSDKRNLTAVFTVSLHGDFLPAQLIYPGTTHRSLPTATFPEGFCVTNNKNHWSNEQTMLLYINDILKPYLRREREKYGNSVLPALLIYDAFRAHSTPTVEAALRSLNARLVQVPKNMTDHLQPLDLSVNRVAKQFLSNCFSDWYGKQVIELESQDNLSHDALTDLIKSSVSLRELSAA